MAAAIGAKNVGTEFRNALGVVRVVYDYAVDGGATGALDLLTAVDDIIVKDFHALVKTTMVGSGGTLIAGISGGDTDALFQSTAVTGLTANTLIAPASTVPFRLASGGKLIQTLASAPLTDGKIEYVFTVMKA